jgi:hypothetical protein
MRKCLLQFEVFFRVLAGCLVGGDAGDALVGWRGDLNGYPLQVLIM